MRAIGLDVHLEFCEVAIWEDGEVRSAGRIETKPERIELFARSLGAEDRVALEVTGNAWEIKRMIEPHVGEVVVVSPNDTGIRSARAKTDRLDARTPARLLAAGELDAVWMPNRETPVMRRRLQRRSHWSGPAPGPRTRSTRPRCAAWSAGLRSATSSGSRAGAGSPRLELPD
jgi:transposase